MEKNNRNKLNIKKIRKDFPILSRKVEGKTLVYLDNAATSQKPNLVIDAVSDFYKKYNANVHRGIHVLSEEATRMYDEARQKVAHFIGATYPEEVIFTKGTTESINRVAFTWGLEYLGEGDEIITTNMEHHSNLVPWQIVSEETGAKLTVLEVNSDGEIPLEVFEEKITKKTKLVAITHVSNVLGTVLPVKEICKLAKDVGALVCVDGAQAVPHMKVSIQSLGCDFYAFSSHKMLGPMGVGVLWVRKDVLDKLKPYEYGGGMIDEVRDMKSTYATVPFKFEAGTPNVAGAVGFAKAIDYLEEMGLENIKKHEQDLSSYAIEKLSEISFLTVLGPKDCSKRIGSVSFIVKGIHSHDIAAILASEGIAVRSGHHCTMPLHKHLGISSSTRASFYLYNTKEEVDKLVIGVKRAIEILA